MATLFGFIKCADTWEVSNLFCIYNRAIRRFGVRMLARFGPAIANLIETWLRLSEAREEHHTEPYTPWFLSMRSSGNLDFPDYDGLYTYIVAGTYEAAQAFNLASPATEQVTEERLSPDERGVLRLYNILFRPFLNIPDPQTAEWMRFGFYSCRNLDERKLLAQMYLQLADSGASLSAIARAWRTSSLPDLFHKHGINPTPYLHPLTRLSPPKRDEMGIYRLIAEVSHALSGCFCACFQQQRHDSAEQRMYCRGDKYETHLSLESAGDYGFHGASPWERWQLLNSYRHVFRQPRFNAREMLAARRDAADPGALEDYLDWLLPGFRRQIANFVLADAMFPRLRVRVQFSDGRPYCCCVVHETYRPPGLCGGLYVS
ncbi:0ef9ec9b-e7cd-408d-9642-6b6389a9ed80 [Thermothielavioides terrestris]|uniref:0ef9ec9b-e7cd-408d-9642-6b6389a9ed80 n=1 Tax=Thermothielavioides terrestris TaxID=2587410 RepID=A0A446BVP6_9PEZI|nr:0ef9ec9b-e7cd-408d-9642-6b6389a9ed80 [Thermothielavioides terrestris]